jgi:hypothetical protein
MRTGPLKIYGGCFDGTWTLRVASTSWKVAVPLLGNMGIGYAKRHGHAWKPRPEDQFLLDSPGVVFRCLATQYPQVWERKVERI